MHGAFMLNVAQNIAAAGTSAGQGGLSSLLEGPLGGVIGMAPWILMFLVIYVLMIRPESKRRKEHQALLSRLKKGDEVVTQSGIFGKVVSVEETLVQLEIASGVKIKLLRDRVAGMAAGSEGKKSSSEAA